MEHQYGTTGRTVQFDALPLDAQGTQSHRVAAEQARLATPPVPNGVNPFALASRPQSEHTIYLDFGGGVVPAESGWNSNGKTSTSLPYPAYSIDTDPAFSGEEQARIFAAWDAVAEDFALFDVNVTTIRPPMSDLVRANGNDARFGVHALVSPAGTPAHQRICDGWCTGMGFLNGIQYEIAATPTREAQPEPVWVFVGPEFTGAGIGVTASHEVGHAVGLRHDGWDEATYYSGDYFWAPIMGSNDGSALVTQWSNGGYAHANNFEDDLSLIARWFPAISDAFADTDAPTPVHGPMMGTVNSNEDADAFTVTARHKTTITVSPTAGTPNIDVMMTVYAADGTAIETVDVQPGAGSGSRDHLAASWTGAASVGDTVTVVVEGTGMTNHFGGYSDYGSVGRYRLDASAAPVTMHWEGPTRPKGLRVGRPTQVKWKVRDIEGTLVSLKRSGTKPRGVRVAVDRVNHVVRLSGTPRRQGTYRMRFIATDKYGDQTITVTFKVTKRRG